MLCAEMGIKMVRVRYSDHCNFYQVCSWCEANCLGKFYVGNDWKNWIPNSQNRMIEFECKEDATLFSLTYP